MKKVPLFIILILFLTALSAAADEAQLPSGTSYSQIGQKIQDYVKEHEKTSAGIATAVFDKDGTIYQGNFGYMNKEKE
mgnify:CR=1 FL=1